MSINDSENVTPCIRIQGREWKKKFFLLFHHDRGRYIIKDQFLVRWSLIITRWRWGLFLIHFDTSNDCPQFAIITIITGCFTVNFSHSRSGFGGINWLLHVTFEVNSGKLAPLKALIYWKSNIVGHINFTLQIQLNF